MKLHNIICGLSLTVCVMLPISSFAIDDDLNSYGDQPSESVSPHGDRLGRLFTTPEQRRGLDRARGLPTLPDQIRFDGISRIKGKRGYRSVIWINGTTDFLNGSFTVSVNNDNSITVTVLALQRSFILLPGQTLNTITQEVVEFYK